MSNDKSVRQEDNPFHHWPYAAEHARRRLDPKQIEAHAVRILARGVRTRRLVAFIGAGTSMAYGRMSWPDLMDLLYEQAMSTANAALNDTFKALWPSLDDFRKERDHALKAQILACAWAPPNLRSHGIQDGLAGLREANIVEQAALHQKQRTVDLLGTHRGFLKLLAQKLGLEPPEAKQPNSRSPIGQEQDHCKRAEGAQGLRAVVEHLLADHDAWASIDQGRRLYTKVENALSSQPFGADSPLQQLIVEWGIRRFATTNYDSEIERALMQMGFVLSDAESHARGIHPGWNAVSDTPATQRSINFTREDTGAALTFAVDGGRRHAMVLHLHGDVIDPGSLVISESDYQRLYLADHPERDLVNNATQANFASNAVLFVGSEVNEDDVLRPVRQFMSGTGHRSDRLAVAVLAGTRPQRERLDRAISLLTKYKVHAVHAVSAKVKSEGGEVTRGEWLPTAFEMVRRLRVLVEKVRDALPANEVSRPKPRAEVQEALDSFLSWRNDSAKEGKLHLGEPVVEIEGIRVCGEADGGAVSQLAIIVPDSLRLLLPGLELLADDVQPGTNDRRYVLSWTDSYAAWLQFCADQWLNHAINSFACAKLLSLRRSLSDVHSNDDEQPRTFRKRPLTSEKQLLQVVDTRHRVCLAPYTIQSRFAKRPADGVATGSDSAEFSEGLDDLVKAIELEQEGTFQTRTKRRLLVVCAGRGAGKGGQFDRLVPSGSRAVSDHLMRVLKALAPGFDDKHHGRAVLHFNLTFADEVAGMVRHLIDAVQHHVPSWQPSLQRELKDLDTKDLIEALDRSLRLLLRLDPVHRIVLILGNAGVLFDSQGDPKNGLVRRVLALLRSPRFNGAPLDIIMYAGESQMPIFLRELRRSLRPTGRDRLPADEAGLVIPGAQPSTDLRRRRRLQRLNIRQSPHHDAGILVHALRHTRVSHLAIAYFKPLYVRLLHDLDSIYGKNAHLELTARCRELYFATGGSRFAQTVVLACLEHSCEEPASSAVSLRAFVNKLRGLSGQTAIESTIELVLDEWTTRFCIAPERLRTEMFPAAQGDEEIEERHKVKHEAFKSALGWVQNSLQLGSLKSGHTTAHKLDLYRKFWYLGRELLWHLSVFSHPVEASTLLACPRVHKAVMEFCQAAAHSGQTPPKPVLVLAVVAEHLCHWCLAFRIGACTLPEPLEGKLNGLGVVRYRYAVHRHLQRHFLKLIGGRSVEASYWDQFTTTLYSSQPDELPSLSAEAHDVLTDVVHTLTGYPTEQHRPACVGDRFPLSRPDLDPAEALIEGADQLRAAYFLVRSTYSMGVVAHLDRRNASLDGEGGLLERHRRTVAWIIQAAKYWQTEHASGIEALWKLHEPARDREPKQADGAPDDAAATDQTERGRAMGVFYPGELVWLYNEAGVISLAQGKLHDAEHALSQAELAAKQIESDDTGSMHVRIRLHAALVHLERGRPHLARAALQPIAERRGGHEVLPRLAEFYLGLLAHIGGDYNAADTLYRRALESLRRLHRSRAAAFVLTHLADVALRTGNGNAAQVAHTTIEEAISLAQQGGHEDVRHIARLAKVRLLIQTRHVTFEKNSKRPNLFGILNEAQRYASDLDMPRISSEVHELRARLLRSQGEYVLSAAEATRGMEIAALYDLKLFKARAMLTLAKIYRSRGDLAGTKALAQSGRGIAQSSDYYTCVRGFSQLEQDLAQHVPADHHPTSGVATTH